MACRAFLGVLLYGCRHFLHRGRGLFQAGGLLLGTLRQVGGRGRNLGCRVRHLTTDRLDVGDGLGQPLGHLVGVVLELAEHAVIIRGDPARQIAVRHCAEQLGKVVHGVGHIAAEAVHGVRKVEHEAALALERNAAGEIAVERRLDEAVDLLLDRLLDGLVPPLDDGTGALAALVEHRGRHDHELLAADREARLVGAGERCQRRILVDRLDIHADQLAAVEARHDPADLRLGVGEHLLQCAVHVDDVAVGVSEHHVRARDVERGADPKVDHLLGDRVLEDFGRLGDVADLVAPGGERHLDDAVVGELAQDTGYAAERPGDREAAEHRRANQHQDNQGATDEPGAGRAGDFRVLRVARRVGCLGGDLVRLRNELVQLGARRCSVGTLLLRFDADVLLGTIHDGVEITHHGDQAIEPLLHAGIIGGALGLVEGGDRLAVGLMHDADIFLIQHRRVAPKGDAGVLHVGDAIANPAQHLGIGIVGRAGDKTIGLVPRRRRVELLLAQNKHVLLRAGLHLGAVDIIRKGGLDLTGGARDPPARLWP